MAFSELEPFGSWFNEYQSALIASVIAEVNRNRKKRGRAYAPKEFMQEWGEADKKKATTPESMFEFVKSVQAALEVKHGRRAPQDLHKAVILDPQGRPASG